MSSIEVRDAEDGDWPAIAVLATTAVAHLPNAPAQDEWVRNRLAVRGPALRRVAVSDGAIVGNVGAEPAPVESKGSYRLFLVLDWASPERIAPTLFAVAENYVRSVDARIMWLREYADDHPFLDFLRRCGFEADAPYVRGDERLVTLTRNISPDG